MKKYAFGTVAKDTRAGFDGMTRTSFSLVEPASRLERVIARADKAGIDFTSIRLTDRRELEGFAEFVGDVWKEHKRLVPRISTTGVIE